MLPFDHFRFRREVAAAFERYYPPETADGLAVMHTQLHMRFAKELARVPVKEGDPRQIVKAQPNLARAIQDMVSKDPLPPSIRRAIGVDVKDEVLDLLLSTGPDHPLTPNEIMASMLGIQATYDDVRRGISELIKEGRVVRQAHTRASKYSIVPDYATKFPKPKVEKIDFPEDTDG